MSAARRFHPAAANPYFHTLWIPWIVSLFIPYYTKQMSATRKLLLFSLLSFLIFSFTHQARAESAGSIQTVPDNYALVGIGYGSDDTDCTVYYKDGRLNVNGTIGEISVWQQVPCTYSGTTRNGDDPMPSSARQKQASQNSYLTGWTWDSNTGGGHKHGSPPNEYYHNDHPPSKCYFQAYQEFNPITKQMIGPIQDFGKPDDGTCSERGYQRSELQNIVYADPGKVLVAVGLSLENDGDVNYVSIAQRANIASPPVTITGRVYSGSTNAGIANSSIFLCGAGSVTTNANGDFSKANVPAGTGYCVRNDSDPYSGFTGPTLIAGYNPSNQDPDAYTEQFAGYDKDGNGRDRLEDTGFDFKYMPGTPTPTPTPIPLGVNLKVRGTTGGWAQTLSGPPPLGPVDLQANVSDSKGGDITYYLYCNRSDTGTNVTTPYNASKVQTGASWTKDDLCNYPTSGTYYAKVIAQNGSESAQDRSKIDVDNPVDLLVASDSINWQTTLTQVAPVAKIIDLKATVNIGSGKIKYYFWCNENDATLDTDNPDAVSTPSNGTNTNPWIETNLCGTTYSAPGTYYPKVVIDRGGQKYENRKPITVTGTLIATLSANPPGPGMAPFSSVLTGGATGTQTGTVNYSFWYQCTDTTTIFQIANNNPACGALPDMTGVPAGECRTNQYGYKCDTVNADSQQTAMYAYVAPMTYTSKVIVERGSLSAQAQVSITVTPDTAPDTPVVTLTEGDYCMIPSETIYWTYNDTNNNPPNPPNNDPQSQYELIIDNNNTFLSPEIDWIKSGTATQDTVIVSSNPTPGLQLAFNTTYYVRVKVWDTLGPIPNTAPSITKTFTTPVHAYPWPSFTWSTPIKVGKPMTFTNTTTLAPGSVGQIWGWIFCADVSQCKTPTSNQQGPLISNTYYQSNPSPGFPVQLTVRDDAGICSTTNNVPVGGSFIPIWREIAPY